MNSPTQAMIDFGHKLRTLRKERGLTQMEFSNICDMQPSYVGLVERAECAPTIRVMERLAKGLNVPIVELFK